MGLRVSLCLTLAPSRRLLAYLCMNTSACSEEFRGRLSVSHELQAQLCLHTYIVARVHAHGHTEFTGCRPRQATPMASYVVGSDDFPVCSRMRLRTATFIQTSSGFRQARDRRILGKRRYCSKAAQRSSPVLCMHRCSRSVRYTPGIGAVVGTSTCTV